jgi:putative membrane protein
MMQKYFREYLGLALKGFAMGAANVIPGVSGGTIALLTGIFEKLIHSLKSMDHAALTLLLKGQFKAFSSRINFHFLLAVFTGAILSVFTIARLLSYLFENFPVYIWAYFFGLILASVYFVGRTVGRWTTPVYAVFVSGLVLAAWISFLTPASGNDNVFYLVLSGMAAVCSMILPGLSGSFVLILMGNYELVAIEAINEMRLDILMPVFLGIVTGLLAFSHFLSWIFRKFRDITLALLTGFIAGSLIILWPWKWPVYVRDELGRMVTRPDGSPVIQNYERYIPDSLSTEVVISLLLMAAGYLTIWLIEKTAEKKPG